MQLSVSVPSGRQRLVQIAGIGAWMRKQLIAEALIQSSADDSDAHVNRPRQLPDQGDMGPVTLSIGRHVRPFAVLLWLQVLSKTMDSTTLSPEKVELATVSRTAAGKVNPSPLISPTGLPCHG
jgi:hypothetical protein